MMEVLKVTISDSKRKLEFRGKFVTELGRSKAKRNVTTNKMKLSQVQEGSLDLAMDWQ